MSGATNKGAEAMLKGLFSSTRYIGLGVSGTEVSGNAYARKSLSSSGVTFESDEFETTLSADPASGDTTVTLTSVTGLSVNDRIHIGTGTSRERVKITAISESTLTLETGLVNDHANGAEVVRYPQLRNTSQLDFATPTGSWGDITEITIHTASTGGDKLYEIDLTNDPEAVFSGNDVYIPAGELAIISVL